MTDNVCMPRIDQNSFQNLIQKCLSNFLDMKQFLAFCLIFYCMENYSNYLQEKVLENERKKLAEDRLAILENQMRIEKETQKERKKQEKKSKQEQMKILGKDKSRPKLSFSLTKN